ncbi:hypothetical protein HZS_3410 [Henneguya salminicola]|nr:hypothetical protein HZS_3410 [Henneguya salminicola]
MAKYKKTSLFGAIIGGYSLVRYARDKFNILSIVKEANQVSFRKSEIASKTFILLDSNKNTYKNFKDYAEPILKATSIDFTIVATNETDMRSILNHIIYRENCKLIIAGDDPYINNKINYLYQNEPQFLKFCTLGLIPTGNVTRIADQLGLTGSFQNKIARSALTCVNGSPTPIHPLIAQYQNKERLILESIKIGYLALYEKFLISGRNKRFGALAYIISYIQALLQSIPDSCLHYNVKDKDVTDIQASSILIRNTPIACSGFSIKCVKNTTFYSLISRLPQLWLHPQNLFILSEDPSIFHKDMVCVVDSCGTEVLCDGSPLLFVKYPISIQQSNDQLFYIYTPFELNRSKSPLRLIDERIPSLNLA